MIKLLFAICFIAGNGLDLWTTYLNQFKLPPELRGKEMNPFVGNIAKHWHRTVFFKSILTFAIAIWLWYLSDMFLWLLLNLAIGFVVLNNAYIYLAKRILHRKVMTLGILYTKGGDLLHLPKITAYLAFMGTIIAASYGLALLIK